MTYEIKVADISYNPNIYAFEGGWRGQDENGDDCRDLVEQAIRKECQLYADENNLSGLTPTLVRLYDSVGREAVDECNHGLFEVTHF